MIIFLAMMIVLQTGDSVPPSEIPPAQKNLTSLPLTTPVIVDGDLSEWDFSEAIVLSGKDQLNFFEGNEISRLWEGESDISAVFYVRHSRGALYIGGRVRDDQFIFNDDCWWRGDALEIFLDVDYEGDRRDNTFSDDDYQIFLMPYSPGRKWGVAYHGRRCLLNDAGFVGVQVAHQEFEGGYGFEAVLPFINFPELNRSERLLGFNIAISDFDQLPDTGERYNYIVCNGKKDIFRYPWNMCRLSLEGEGIGFYRGTGVRQPEPATSLVLVFAVSVLVILVAALFSGTIYNTVQRYFPRWRQYGVALFIFFLFVIFVVPQVIVKWRESGVRSLLEEGSVPLSAVAEELCRDDVSLGRGGLRTPDSILALLTGEMVGIEDDYRYFLVDEASCSKGRESLSGIPFLNYGFSLEEGRDYRFPPPRAEPFSGIALCLSTAFRKPLAMGAASKGVIDNALDLEIRFGSGTAHKVSLPLRDCSAGGAPLGSDFWSLAWRDEDLSWDQYSIDLPGVFSQDPVTAVILRLVDPNVEVRLAGMTGISTAGGHSFFCLGNETITGVPTWLRDGFMPQGCGRTILRTPIAGEESLTGPAVFTLKEPADVLFFVYASKDFSLLDKEKYGEEVARIILRYDDGRSKTTKLLAGVHVDYWSLDLSNHPESMESDIAYQWEDGGVKLHYDILRIDLDKKENPLRSVVVTNSAASGSGFILGAVTAGIRIERGPIANVLLGEQGDSLFVAPAVIEGIRDFRLTLFRDGTAKASSHAGEIADRLVGSALPDETRALLPENDFVFSEPSPFQAGGKRFLGGYMGIPIEGAGRLHLRAALELEPLAAVGRWQKILAVPALVLFLPFFIMFFVDLLGRIRIIRVKLTLLFILTSVIPIVFLSLFMFNLLVSQKNEQTNDRLLDLLTRVNESLENQVRLAEKTGARALNSQELIDLLESPDPDETAVSSFLRRFLEESFSDDGIERAVRLEVEPEEGTRRLFFSSDEHSRASLFDDTESGLYYHWGRFQFIGTSRVDEGPGIRLSIGGFITERFLDGLARDLECRKIVISAAASGFPVVGRGFSGEKGSCGIDHDAVREWLDKRKEPFIGESGGKILFASDYVAGKGGELLREGSLLVEAYLQQDEYLLEIFLTQVEIKEFFLIFGVIILASAIFIGTVTTYRITHPIENLEKGAGEVSRGNLDYKVDETTGDEMGRLARAFNLMTRDLKLRVEEQQRLNKNMNEMSAGLDFQGKVEAAIALLKADLGADRAVFFLRDPQMNRFEAAEDTKKKCRGMTCPAGSAFLAESLTNPDPGFYPDPPSSEFFDRMEGIEKEIVRPENPLVVLPLHLSGRALGAILLVLPRRDENERAPALPGLPVNMEYLESMAHQIAGALENARLYLMAIRDPDTGFYTRSFFQYRLAEEVDRAVRAGGKTALLRVALGNLDLIKREASQEKVRFLIEGMAAAIKKVCGDIYFVGRNTPSEFDIILPDAERKTVQALAGSLVGEMAGAAGAEGISPDFRFGLALCPDDASSARFLLDSVSRSIEKSWEEKDAEETPDLKGLDIDSLGYVFQSTAMRDILLKISRFAQSSVSVLIQGETGVGKEVAAEIIHRSSNRVDRPFIRLNCSALPESLLESELFGHEKGAFTGADKKKAGHFEVADTGTLFLDEVGDLSLRTQAKLLRVLQDKTIERLGSSGRPISVDVRIIAATNKDLMDEIGKGNFREDLYYRLKVISITIPPLRERKEDIPLLIQRFREEFVRENRRNVRGVSPAALDLCYRNDWPGNVRELKNVLNRAMFFMEGDIVEPSHLVFESLDAEHRPAGGAPWEDEVLKNLKRRQVQLLILLQTRGTITNKEYMEMMGISSRTGLRDLQELLELGLIIRQGSRRAAVYRLKESSIA